MKEFDEKIPDPKEIEKEISEFIAKKFGGNVKIASHFVMPQEVNVEKSDQAAPKEKKINFNLKPEELVSYLDQYIVKQDNAKAVLATKICTHFNRVKRLKDNTDDAEDLVGGIKSNVLMIGPTGVGKTYIIKLIANRIGIPFVKGDATKFSETGYVGGDVEDLVRDLVREADDDIEAAEYGIIYIDEIDKIASSRNLIGADVSRTGVQRALLKPMEETDVEMKVPHDPISMIQEIDQFRKTGKRNSRTVNTKNILFIMSGAFNELGPIIQKRISSQSIGFSASFSNPHEMEDILKHVSSEDLIELGFESEFVGRLPIRTVFEKLTKGDLFEILRNPNNPIILGKKLDFAAYGIDAKFDDNALRLLAEHAFAENTGARGLVSAVEKALLVFEKKLPSTNITSFPITEPVIKNPELSLEKLIAPPEDVS
ncbi:MAG: AAA family ATPase, partial [Deltaproteobacteria bacterium]|nr:AAA family ATPase [Deltaproteobacteria bacterium]